MTPLQPKGEKMRQAVKFISESLKDDETASIHKLIQKASFKFNLSPRDEEFLLAFYKEGGNAPE